MVIPTEWYKAINNHGHAIPLMDGNNTWSGQQLLYGGVGASVPTVTDNAADEAFDVTVNALHYQQEFDGAEMLIQLQIPSVLKAAPILLEGYEDKDGVELVVESASS